MIVNENDPRSTAAFRKRLAAIAVPTPTPARKPLPPKPATVAAIRRLSVDERRQFMESSDFLRSADGSGDLVDGLDHYEGIVAKPVADALWRAAHEVDPLINRGTRAYMTRTSGRSFDVLVRSLATLDPPAAAPAGTGLLSQLQGRAVPYDTFSIVGYYEESHAYGSLDGSTGPGQPALPLMWNHGKDNPWPIGRSTLWDSRSDGLHGTWQLGDEPDAQRAARQARSGEALGFLSIAFVAIRSEWDMHPHWDPLVGNLDRVTRTESRLTEVSIVHAPAFPTATVSNVRGAHTQQRRANRSPAAMFPESVVAWRVEVAALKRRHPTRSN